jgi:hypothetical protein
MQQPYKRNTKLLWALVVLTLTYTYLLYFLRTLTGMPLLDGSIGVILGLYTCSRPAAHAVDMIFAERTSLWRVTSKGEGLGWLALNLLVLLLGLMTIMIGVMRLVD